MIMYIKCDLEAANSGRFDAGNHFSRNGTSWWTRLTSSSCLQESVSEKAKRKLRSDKIHGQGEDADHLFDSFS